MNNQKLAQLKATMEMLNLATSHLNCAMRILKECEQHGGLDEDLCAYLCAIKSILVGDQSAQWFLGGLITAIRERVRNANPTEEIWEHA